MVAVVFMMFMAIVADLSLEGKCLSLQGPPAEGVLVTVVPCDDEEEVKDPWQNIWVGSSVVGTDGEKVYRYCINETLANLCNGYQKDGDTYQKYQALVIADPASPAQQWKKVGTTELPHNFINLGVNLCDEIVDNGLLEGKECRNIPAQQWV